MPKPILVKLIDERDLSIPFSGCIQFSPITQYLSIYQPRRVAISLYIAGSGYHNINNNTEADEIFVYLLRGLSTVCAIGNNHKNVNIAVFGRFSTGSRAKKDYAQRMRNINYSRYQLIEFSSVICI